MTISALDEYDSLVVFADVLIKASPSLKVRKYIADNMTIPAMVIMKTGAYLRTISSGDVSMESEALVLNNYIIPAYSIYLLRSNINGRMRRTILTTCHNTIMDILMTIMYVKTILHVVLSIPPVIFS